MLRLTLRWARLDEAPTDAAFLDGGQRARLESFFFDADRRRFVGARLLLRQAVAEVAGCRSEDVVLHQTCRACGGPHGRPTIEVLGERGPHVSFAHAGEMAVVAVSNRPVGVDAEARSAGATADWLRWEATVKATGEGLAGPAPQAQAYARRRGIHLQDLEFGPGHVGAVAILGRGPLRADASEQRLRQEDGEAAETSAGGSRNDIARSPPPANVAAMYDRRTFLRRAALGGASVALLGGLPRPAAAADEDLAPFLHGVASGDPTPEAVILWTRLTPPSGAALDVAWRVARDVTMTDVVASGVERADAARDFTVKVDAAGLQPGTWYFYEFEAAGRRSIVGRTKTAPLTSDHLRFGVVSCSNYQGGFFNAYARLAERDDLDAIIHLGDYIYEYGNGDDRYGPGGGELASPRDHQPATEMVTLTDYRLRHSNYKLDPDLRRLHQLFPWITTWDDHESTNNSHRDGAQNHDPGSEGDWGARKAAAQRAYSEWMPIRVADPAKIYRTLRYGGLADIIVMDTRLDGRDPEVGTVGTTILSGADIDDPNRQMISVEQRQMVFDSLARRDSQWKIVAQQVILGQWNGGGVPRLPDNPDLPQFFLRDGGNALNPDQWDGYTAERDRLFGHIADTDIDNVVVLTGDVHTSWALDLTPDPYNPSVYNPVTGDGALGVEFVTPSVTSANFESLGSEGALALETGTKADNPHVKFVDFDDHGYFVLDLTPERAQADWFYVDTVLEPSDSERLGASWQSVAGDNHVTAASAPAATGAPAPATPAGSPRVLAADGTAVPPSAGATQELPATGASTLAGAAALGAAAVVAKVIERRNRLGA